MKKILTFLCLAVSTLCADYVEEKQWGSDTLLSFFEKNKIPLKTYYNLDKEDQTNTEDIAQGVRYHILKTDDDKIRQILIPISQELQLHIDRVEDGSYKLSVVPISYQKKEIEVMVHMTTSVYQDIVAVTDDHYLANEFITSYKKTINFEKSVKRGNKLAVIYESNTRLGKAWGVPIIKTAMVETGNTENYIFLANDGIYYDDKGVAIESFLLSRPLKNYTCISSGFTLKRFHPILHIYRAHHGIDYATPIGTAVYASGDGKVVSARYRDGYGNTLEIVHEDGFKTLYGHLKGFATGIRVGKIVKNGQLVAYSGNTGLSSGPHLHFGLYKRDTPIDPNKAIRVSKRSVLNSQKDTFFQDVKMYKNRVASMANGIDKENQPQQDINLKISDIDENFRKKF